MRFSSSYFHWLLHELNIPIGMCIHIIRQPIQEARYLSDITLVTVFSRGLLSERLLGPTQKTTPLIEWKFLALVLGTGANEVTPPLKQVSSYSNPRLGLRESGMSREVSRRECQGLDYPEIAQTCRRRIRVLQSEPSSTREMQTNSYRLDTDTFYTNNYMNDFPSQFTIISQIILPSNSIPTPKQTQTTSAKSFNKGVTFIWSIQRF